MFGVPGLLGGESHNACERLETQRGGCCLVYRWVSASSSGSKSPARQLSLELMSQAKFKEGRLDGRVC